MQFENNIFILNGDKEFENIFTFDGDMQFENIFTWLIKWFLEFNKHVFLNVDYIF